MLQASTEQKCLYLLDIACVFENVLGIFLFVFLHLLKGLLRHKKYLFIQSKGEGWIKHLHTFFKGLPLQM